MNEQPQNPPPSVSEQELWDEIRDDYLAGVTAPVLAERYAVSVRTIRRRAATEGWRRSDRVMLEDPPPWGRLLDRDEAIDRFPQLAEAEAARSCDVYDLLIDPDQRSLRRFAFIRAAECAALERPTEAVVWMRLVQQLDRSGQRLDAESQPFPEADYMRARYLRRLAADIEPDPEPSQGEVSSPDEVGGRDG